MNFLRKNIFLLLIPLMLVATPVLSQIENFVKVRIVDYSGGQVSKNYADELTNTQGALIQNAIINVKGQLSSRLGQLLFNTDTNGTAFAGIGRFDLENAGTTTSYLVVASAPSVVRSLSNGTTWIIINSGHAITTGKNTEFVQANNQLFMLNGFDNDAWWDGSSWTVGGTYPGSASPPVANTGSWLSNYLFLAGNSTNQDYIYVSDNTAPTSFQGNQIIKVNSGDGQPIKKLQAYRTGDLIAYKERSIWDLNITGVNSLCTPQPICAWSLTPITTDVGTLSPRSVVTLGNDQWFLSSPPFGIRSVIRSQFDKTFVNLISQPIQDIFDGTNIDGTILNTQQVAKAAGVYFDNKYIIAIPTSSSTVNNLVLVYDFITQSWYEITGWYPSEWLVYNYNLYYIDANDGRVIQCFIGSTGDYGTVIPAASTGPSVGVDFNYISRIFDFDQPDNYKSLDSIQLEFNPTGNYNATININLDNTGWQFAGTIPLTSQAVTLPVNLPFNLSSPGLTYATLQLTKYGRFKKIQIQVEIQGVSQQIILQKITCFARLNPWNREQQ